MLFFTRLVTLLVLVVGSSLANNWTKPYPLKLGGVAAVIIGIVLVAVLWVTRTRPVKGARGRDSLLRELLLGGVAAVAWLGAMYLYFEVAERTTGFSAMILDRDCGEIEEKAALHENVGNYKAAADVYLEGLRAPRSRECAKSFAEQAILNLARAAKAVDRKTQEELLRKALEVAARFKVSDDLPKQVLHRLLEGNALGEVQEKLNSAEARAKKAEDDRQTHIAAAEELEHRSDSLQDALARLAETAASNAASLAGNVIDGDLNAARQTLLRVIRETGKSDGAGKVVLGKLEAAILAMQPATLPEGATARIRRIDANVMAGLALVDIEVLTASGKPLGGLVSKDFSTVQGGRKLRVLASPMSRTESHFATALLDISASTEGLPNTAMKSAVSDFIARLSANASIRVVTFGDRVNLISDFTQDRNLAISAIQRIRAGGGTALNQGTYEEVHVLSAKPGVRDLVCFTDGTNSLPGPRVEVIIQAARNAKVRVHFVALKGTGYSDTSAIERIARETGGKTFVVQHAHQLTESFRAVSDSLQETGYRLALLDYTPNTPLQLTIGGGAGIHLAIDSSKALAQRQEH